MTDYWQIKHLTQKTHVPENTIRTWIRGGKIPTTKINGINHIHPNDIPHILNQIHLTRHGKKGWANYTELRKTYNTTRQAIHLWHQAGLVTKTETYGNPLFRIADVEREILLAHQRHNDAGKGPRGRKPQHYIPEGITPAPIAVEPPAPKSVPDATPQKPATECSHSNCGHPGTDEPIPGIGLFCATHADEKRRILGIKQRAA